MNLPRIPPRSSFPFLLTVAMLLASCTSCTLLTPVPPVAFAKPSTRSIHGHTRVDPYAWLSERGSRDVIAYLKAENRYTDAMMKSTRDLQETLYQEMKARIKETDLTVPVEVDDYYYYTRTMAGRQYRIHCRKQGSLDFDEHVILDENRLAAGHDYFRLGMFEVSPDHKLLAYSVDVTGDEVYTIYFKDLETGGLLLDEIPNTYYSAAWANDNRTFFYTTLDEAKRPYKVYRHVLGTDPREDRLVHHEKDERFFVRVGKTRSRRFILLNLASQITSEVRFLPADRPMAEFLVLHPRQQGMEYRVEHHGDSFFVVTNDEAVNFKLVEAPVDSPQKSNWKEVIPHRSDIKLDGVDAFAGHLAIYERRNGLRTLRVKNLATGEEQFVSFPEPVYTFFPTGNEEFQTKVIRFNYTSLVTPRSVFDYHMDTGERELKKQEEVLGGYDPSHYASERIEATAPDGTRVPISLAYHKGMKRDGTNPLLLTGYGAYGASSDPYFSSDRVSLLDRGFIFAIAHVRGGGELGRPWYEDGKLLHKRNTFTDFIACADYLIAEGYTSPDKLAITGGSAGGLLIGAVLNMRPDLFGAAVARVPFVDVVNTMLDPSVPLTVIEFEEWGNPAEPAYYDYMMSYSPYDNVKAQGYPDILVTAGLNDPRVQYWEPAKWTARLRALKTDDNLLLLKTNMGAGHGGASGRYDRLRELAFQYAFILDRVGGD